MDSIPIVDVGQLLIGLQGGVGNAMKYMEELTDAEAISIFEVGYEWDEFVFRLARGKNGN